MTMPPRPFAGRTVVITGAGSNLGRTLALRFHAAGARLAICDIDPRTVRQTVAMIGGADRSRIHAAACDISREAAVRRFFRGVARAFGRVHVLVNNAAHLGVDQPTRLLDQTSAGFARVLAVNAVGTFQVTREAVRLMRAGGTIVNIGSNTGGRAIRGRPAYIASKGAISSLTRALAVDLAPRIRVNELAPGYIVTPRWSTIGAKARRVRHSNVPLGEPATAEQVADAALFLASEGAAAITGARIVIDGGVDAQLLPTSCQF